MPDRHLLAASELTLHVHPASVRKIFFGWPEARPCPTVPRLPDGPKIRSALPQGRPPQAGRVGWAEPLRLVLSARERVKFGDRSLASGSELSLVT